MISFLPQCLSGFSSLPAVGYFFLDWLLARFLACMPPLGSETYRAKGAESTELPARRMNQS